MRKRSFYKDIIRTLRKNLSRFIAIIVMVALGSGVFAGFAVGCLNVFQSANRFYATQNMYDIKIASTLGLTEDDLTIVSKMTGVSEAFGNCSLDVKAILKDGKSMQANLTTLDISGMNEPYVLEGTQPMKAGQIAVNSKFIADTGLKIGDVITLTKTDKAKETVYQKKEADTEEGDATDFDFTVASNSSEPALAVSEYVITAIILSPLDISNKEGSVASISLSAGDSVYLLYTTSDCIDSNIYTAIYLTVDGTEKLNCYSEEYRTLVSDTIARIEQTIQKECELTRYNEVVGDANANITDAEELLLDKMTEAEQKFTDAQTEIDEGWIKIKEGLMEISDNEEKLTDGQQKLADAKKAAEEKFVASQTEIDNGRKALKEGEVKLCNEEDAALKQFGEYEQQLEQNKEELEKQRSDADSQLSSTVAGLQADAQIIWKAETTRHIWENMITDSVPAAPYLIAVKQGEIPSKDQTNAYNAAMVKVQTDTQALAGTFISAGSYLTEAQVNTFSNLAVTYGTLNYSRTQLEEKSVLLSQQKADAFNKISAARQEIELSEVKLNSGQKKLEEGIAAAKVQFADKKRELTEGEHKLKEAKKKLRKAEEKLADGQKELDKNIQDYEDSIATAQSEIADAKEKIANISMAKWYVWDRSNNDSFASLDSDISFIQEITKAFPFIFFLVAILICLTTMTRMVEEDRGLIGTYKSLGYTKITISLKYILYSVLACVFGGLLGIVIGFYALPKIIKIIVDTLYVLPTFRLSFYPSYGFGGLGLFLLGIVGATTISCAEILHKRPSELMRPKAPKAGNRILLERIPFLWKRLNFLNKVTCRNLFRYKKRAIMTIVGILGCTILIVFGFGIRDTVGGLMSDQYDTITVYDAMVVTDDLSTDEMKAIADEWNKSKMVESELQLRITTLTLQNKRNNLDITVMVIPDGANLGEYVHLKDSLTHKAMSLPSDGIVVTQNAAKQLKITNNDIVSLQNDENQEHDFTVAFIAANYAGNYVYISKSCLQAAFGDFLENAFLLKMYDSPNGQEWLSSLGNDTRILAVSNNQEVIDSFQDVNQIINMIVNMLIAMSAVLAFAVLFTLSNINISERERELATVKVLGFLPKEVYSYVNKETLILTLLGIILGLPAGYGVTYFILFNVSIANVAFKVRVSGAAYFIAAVLTIVFALIVNRATNKTLHKINMVGALKSVE